MDGKDRGDSRQARKGGRHRHCVKNRADRWSSRKSRKLLRSRAALGVLGLPRASPRIRGAGRYLRRRRAPGFHGQPCGRKALRAHSDASSTLPVIKEQIAKQGIGAASDSEWRQRQKEIRMENAREGMRAALVEMGSTAARYFTPEEKVSFAQFAQKLRGSMIAPDVVERFAIPLVQSAGLAEKEAAWRYELLMSANKRPEQLIGDMNAYIELQRRRLTLADLGSQLERFAPRVSGGNRSVALIAAAQAYRGVGDEENELRLLASVGPDYLGAENQKRLF